MATTAAGETRPPFPLGDHYCGRRGGNIYSVAIVRACGLGEHEAVAPCVDQGAVPGVKAVALGPYAARGGHCVT